MRIATFNALHGRSVVDGQVDVDRFAAAVAALDADVVALQEVDRAQPRSHEADLTAAAAAAMGASWSRFAPALTGLPGVWQQAVTEVPEGTPQYGVALLSRRPVLSSRVVRLPAARGTHPVWFRGRRRPVLVRDEPRVAVVAELEDLTVVGTHLSYLPVWQLVQLRTLVASLPRRGPLVLMGDLNVGPSTAVRTTGLRPLGHGPTYPSPAPTRQIDHVLGRDVRSLSSDVVHLPVSDHRALRAYISAV